jgi:spore coat polysaccharide biosynthesis predicted glycosyltransferase SpsG
VHAITGVEDPDGWMTRLQRESDRKWTFTRMCNRMAEVLAVADLAVTGGGLTKYETALLGVPSVVLSQVEHQHTLMTDFQEAETCLYTGRAGSIDEEELADTLQSLSSSPDRLAEMSRNGQKLVDGNGRKRIIDYLTS